MLTFSGTIARVLLPTICDAVIKEASFKRDIIRHAKKRHPIDLDTVLFECKFCKEAFPDRRKATTHQATHIKDPLFEIETYPCSSCNRAFAMQKALSSHNRQCKAARPIEQDGCSLSSSMRGSEQPVPSPPPPQFSDSEDSSSTNQAMNSLMKSPRHRKLCDRSTPRALTSATNAPMKWTKVSTPIDGWIRSFPQNPRRRENRVLSRVRYPRQIFKSCTAPT